LRTGAKKTDIFKFGHYSRLDWEYIIITKQSN